MDMAAFVRRYAEESIERLRQMESALARLESTPGDRSLIEEIMRGAHTVKGGARMLRLTEVQDLSHAFEESLTLVFKGTRVADATSMDAFFAATAGLRDLVTSIAAGGGAPNVDVNALCRALEGGSAVPTAMPARSLQDPPLRVAEREPVTEPGAPSTVATAAVPTGDPSRPSHSVRVAVTRLDALGRLAVEQAVEAGRARSLHGRLESLGFVMSRIRSVAGGRRASQALLAALGDGERLLRRLVEEDEDAMARRSALESEVRAHVQALRLTPLHVVLDAFPASVREIARGFGKEVDLVVVGGDSELDRRIVDEIGEPLVHMLRNALDHGIEDPAEREAAGKSRRGRISITARAAEGAILITVEDDGRGIDPRSIRRAAIARGLLDEEEAQRLTDEQALDLVFVPGFSTRDTVSALSGRGVGMDTVRVSLTRLGGSVSLHSRPGQGTRIECRMPLTLALLKVILFRVGHEILAVPVTTVERVGSFAMSDRLPPAEEGDPLPVVSMAAILELDGEGPEEVAPPCWLVLRGSGSRAVFVVDEILEEAEVALKEAPKILSMCRSVSGMTLLPSGRPAVVLEVSDLLSRVAAGEGVR